MGLLVFDGRAVEALLPMSSCLDLMADALAALARDESHNPLRFVVRPPDARGLLGLMPAHRGGDMAGYGLKAVCIYPDNPARGLDAHQGGVLLFDPETGELRALLNASAVTAIRTAAVSGVATRLLAREDAQELALLGSGVQARSHLEAMLLVRPFTRVRVWSRRPERARQFVATSPPRDGITIDAVEAAVRGAHVIVTATSAREPIIEHSWVQRGAHINAVGSSIPTTREIETATMAAAALFVDRRESTVNESGDYLFALRDGAIGPSHIRAELGELLIGAATGRSSADEITLFKSLGLAVEDLAAAQHVVAQARRTGGGQEVTF